MVDFPEDSNTIRLMPSESGKLSQTLAIAIGDNFFRSDWDKIGGLVGEGGIGDSEKTRSGNNGCVRIFKPGHY